MVPLQCDLQAMGGSLLVYRPDLETPSVEDAVPALTKMHMWPLPYVASEDVAHAVLVLASDASRFLTTGTALPVDLSMIEKCSSA